VKRSERLLRQAFVEALRLTGSGFHVISPLAMIGPMLEEDPGNSFGFPLPDPYNRTAWREWCRPFLDVCRVVIVPDLPGAVQSDAIRDEVRFAIKRNKIVYFYEQ
jgi:hypothetical protein